MEQENPRLKQETRIKMVGMALIVFGLILPLISGASNGAGRDFFESIAGKITDTISQAEAGVQTIIGSAGKGARAAADELQNGIYGLADSGLAAAARNGINSASESLAKIQMPQIGAAAARLANTGQAGLSSAWSRIACFFGFGCAESKPAENTEPETTKIQSQTQAESNKGLTSVATEDRPLDTEPAEETDATANDRVQIEDVPSQEEQVKEKAKAKAKETVTIIQPTKEIQTIRTVTNNTNTVVADEDLRTKVNQIIRQLDSDRPSFSLGQSFTMPGNLSGKTLNIGSSGFTVDDGGNVAAQTITAAGNVTVQGNFTVSGAQTFSGASALGAATAAPLFAIDQSGAGAALRADNLIFKESTISTDGTDTAILLNPNGTGAVQFHTTGNHIDSAGNLVLAGGISAASLNAGAGAIQTTGAITGGTFNGLALASLATGFSVAGGTASTTLTMDAVGTASNWNTAFGWGNWAHTTLAGYGITDALGLHDTADTATNLVGLTATISNLNSVTGLLGTAAFTASSAYATAAQGTLATDALPAASFTDAAVTGKLITGYASGAGTVAAADTILQAINKLNGNSELKAPLASPTFTGSVTMPGTGIWNSSGNVGVGTAVPQSALDLGAGTNGRSLVWGGSAGNGWYGSIGTSYGSADLNILSGIKLDTASDAHQYSYTGTYGVAGMELDYGAGDIHLFTEASAAHTAGNVFNPSTNEKMTIKAGGNVGIGTTAPAEVLSISGTGSNPLSITRTGSSNNVPIKITNDTNSVYFGMNANEDFAVGTTADLAVDGQFVVQRSSGNVGIGTTAPTAPLQITGGTADNVASLIDNNKWYAGLTNVGAASRLIGIGSVNNDVYLGAVDNAGGKVIIREDGTDKVTIDGGNVGIGTTSPDAKLTLQALGSGTGELIESWKNNGGDSRFTFLYDTQNIRYSIGGRSSNPFFTIVETSGNVGIGTTAPRTALDVNGQITGGFGAKSGSGTLDWNDSTNARPGSGYSLLLGDATNGPGPTGYYHPFSFEYSTKDATGNITQLAIPYATGNGLDSGIYFRGRYSNAWSSWRKILSENASGNVGIGTTSPGAKLNILGSAAVGQDQTAIRFSDTATSNSRDWAIGSGSGTAYGDLAFLVGASQNSSPFVTGKIQVLTLKPDGKMGIGYTNPSYQLQLSTDSAAKPSTNTWTIASDARVKTGIRPFSDGLAVINGINPVWYQYNGKAGFVADGKDYIGVLAQDIMKAAPYTVSTYKAKLNPTDPTETELYNFNSHALTFVMINAIKEQQKEIDGLKLVLNPAGAISNASSTLATADGSGPFAWLANGLNALGLALKYGAASLREVVADRFTAKELQMMDKATGEKYCTWIENGEWMKTKGECGAVPAPAAPVPPAESTEKPAETPAEAPPVSETNPAPSALEEAPVTGEPAPVEMPTTGEATQEEAAQIVGQIAVEILPNAKEAPVPAPVTVPELPSAPAETAPVER
ncbi:MAG: tail fiber domain-containing protein [Victivallaceae bacterium]|jgi:hypothetical protein